MRKKEVAIYKGRTVKYLDCECGETVEVPEDTKSVICPLCVVKQSLTLFPPK